MGDNPILIASLVFIAFLGFLTIGAAVETGPSILTVVSLVVLALFGFGILNALRQPPEE